jgi:hypothetical protein
MNSLRLKLGVWIALLAFGGTIAAQSIAPPIAEFRGTRADGMFEIRNTSSFTMAVVLETRSFEVDGHGQVLYRPLDPGISIRMGASSFVLRPHDSRMIFYKATFPSAPASFSIIPTMTKAGVLEGVRINYILPHMIYVYQKEKLQRDDVRVDVADGVLRVRNLSRKLARVEAVQASKQDLGGFPLFPGQTREMPITGNNASVAFEDGFKVNVP